MKFLIIIGLFSSICFSESHQRLSIARISEYNKEEFKLVCNKKCFFTKLLNNEELVQREISRHEFNTISNRIFDLKSKTPKTKENCDHSLELEIREEKSNECLDPHHSSFKVYSSIIFDLHLLGL